METCPVCGKRFVVLWPDLWPFRWKGMLFCREACMVIEHGKEYRERIGWIDDYCKRKKEGKSVSKKMVLEQKKKAVEIAIAGGDPLKYLKECGSKNPSAHWFYIKKTLKEKDPVTYALLMAPEEPKITLTIDSEDLAEIAGSPEEPDEVKEEPAVFHRVQAVALDDDFEIYGLKTKAGDFQTAAGNLCWTFDGFQMNLPVERWRQLIETVPKVLNVMKL